jgi:aminopeptidase
MSSTSAYILPYDPKASAKSPEVAGVDAPTLWALTPGADKPPKVAATRTFFNTPAGKVTAVTSIGDAFASKKAEEKREIVRRSIATAVKDLKSFDGLGEVAIDASIDPHAAGASSPAI